MKIENLLNNYSAILCLNGKLPSKEYISSYQIIIAADGAANKLEAMGITPSIIIGDLDSIDQQNYPESEIIFIPNQDKTDFAKALDYIQANNIGPTIVCGVSGGFLDHIIQNINLILENNCALYAPPLIGLVLKENESRTFSLEINTKISLFAMPRAIVNTRGLKWELNDEILEFPGKNSCLNRTASPLVNIDITAGKVLLLLYNEKISDMGGE
jgi:thiamine pyrophosphokinase